MKKAVYGIKRIEIGSLAPDGESTPIGFVVEDDNSAPVKIETLDFGIIEPSAAETIGLFFGKNCKRVINGCVFYPKTIMLKVKLLRTFNEKRFCRPVYMSFLIPANANIKEFTTCVKKVFEY